MNPNAPSVETDDTLASVRPSLIRRAASQWGRWPGSVLRTMLMALPLAWFARSVDLAGVLAQARRVGLTGLGLGVALHVTATLVSTLRWRYLMGAYGADRTRMPSFASLARANFVGLYFSLLPSGIAGDAVRGYRVQRCWKNPVTAYMVLFVERLTGLFGLLAIAAVSAGLSPRMQGGRVAFALNVGIALAFVLSAGAFALPQLMSRSPKLRALVARLPVAGRMLATLEPPVRPWGPLAVLPIAITVHLLVIASAATLIGPLDPHATFAACCRVMPAVMLMIQVPLTPAGFGQREMAFGICFATIGVTDPEKIVAASLMFATVSITTALLGGVVLAYERARGVTFAAAR